MGSRAFLFIILACFFGISCAMTSQQLILDDQVKMVKDLNLINSLYTEVDRLSDEINHLTNSVVTNEENYEQPREIEVNGELTSNEAIDAAAVTHNPLHTGVVPAS